MYSYAAIVLIVLVGRRKGAEQATGSDRCRIGLGLRVGCFDRAFRKYEKGGHGISSSSTAVCMRTRLHDIRAMRDHLCRALVHGLVSSSLVHGLALVGQSLSVVHAAFRG